MYDKRKTNGSKPKRATPKERHQVTLTYSCWSYLKSFHKDGASEAIEELVQDSRMRSQW